MLSEDVLTSSKRVVVHKLVSGQALIALQGRDRDGSLHWVCPCVLTIKAKDSASLTSATQKPNFDVSFGILIDMNKEMHVQPNEKFLESQVLLSYDADDKLASSFMKLVDQVRAQRSGIVTL